MIYHGDCLDVMPAMEPESVHAIVTDPPYGLGFMGKAWDDAARLASVPPSGTPDTPLGRFRTGKGPAAVAFDGTGFQRWSQQWAEAAYRVAKPSAYLLAFGGTRTVHRMTVALEDAGWIIRDMLVWGYASGFPKSKASLKPAWEPIVMARKPGPLRMLAIDECRIGPVEATTVSPVLRTGYESGDAEKTERGRWPANIVLTDPIFDGGIEGVVGGGEASVNPPSRRVTPMTPGYDGGWTARDIQDYGDSGTYSRFFLVPKADRVDREPQARQPWPPRWRASRGSVSSAKPSTSLSPRHG